MIEDFLKEIALYTNCKYEVQPIALTRKNLYGITLCILFYYHNGVINKEIISNNYNMYTIDDFFDKYSISKKDGIYVSNNIIPNIMSLVSKPNNDRFEAIVYTMDNSSILYKKNNTDESILYHRIYTNDVKCDNIKVLEHVEYVQLDYTTDNLNIIDDL